MERVILTGFEPFGPYTYNPTKDTVKKFDGYQLGNVEIVSIVLPASYYGAFDLLADGVNKFSPTMILSTGFASGISKIRYEAVARNLMKGKYADNDGYEPDNLPIVKLGKFYHRTNVDNIALAFSLYCHRVGAEVSIDPDTFVCNSLIYLTARKIEKENLPIAHAFIHTPWTTDYLGKADIAPGKVVINQGDLETAIEVTIAGMHS